MLGVIALQVGKNDIAVKLISQALAVTPKDAEAHNNLGTAFENLGELDKAVASYRQALDLKPDFAKGHFNLGNALCGLKRPDDAVANYQKAIDIKPDYAEAHSNLGNALGALGKLDEAVASYNKAITINPDLAEAHNNLGNVFKNLSELEKAVASYQKAIEIHPKFAEAHNNLGTAIKDLGRPEDAVGSYLKALDINPDYVEAHNNLGTALEDLGEVEKAANSYRLTLSIQPDFAKAHSNLGNALVKLGKFDEAVTSLKKALAINPDLAETHNILGVALKNLGRPDEAAEKYYQALALNPDYVEAHSNLGNVLKELGLPEDAVASYQKAIAINPDYAEAHNNLGLVLQELGKPDEARVSFQNALAIKPDYAIAHSNLLLAEQYRLGHNAETLFNLHCEWGDQHGEAFRSGWPAHENTREADRRLKVGFVSPDLGQHPVGYFVIPLLENLAGQNIQTVCYSDRIEDGMTGRIQAAADVWHNTYGVSDEDLTKTILSDGIDILIDLSGHSARNRMLVFARKPAPLQVAWAGYVGTTGLAAIDYLISDIYSTPVNEESFYSEKIIRMPDGWLCYAPPDYAPAVGPLPGKQSGDITFSSFSNPMKINEDVVSVWARILDRVAGSRLLIKFKGMDTTSTKDRLTGMFEAKGVDRSRLMLEGSAPHIELLARYNDVDIALDPFPYSGGLTTYEALWMGVPVITAPGKTFASRHSQSHLSTLGQPELIAKGHDDYVTLAVDLANDPDRLAGLRSGLRATMSSSPICDGEKFAGGFAELMRDIWRQWCTSPDNEKQ